MQIVMSAVLVERLQVAIDSQFNATPAVSGTTLLLRSDKFLYSIQPQ